LTLIQYHQSTGPYPYLSENYFCDVPYEGTTWPSAQHAFQAAKISRSVHSELASKWREQIFKAKTMKEVTHLGRKVIERDAAFKNRGHAIEIMFQIILAKFRHNRHLAHRLIYDTIKDAPDGSCKEKPIWHIAENFWGTAAYRDDSAPKNSRHGSANQWHSGDNWNGKILSVIRKLLLKELASKSPVTKTLNLLGLIRCELIMPSKHILISQAFVVRSIGRRSEKLSKKSLGSTVPTRRSTR
jgi:predicted NAD-dependent protein-ADP-ribosyltransferase YbiA (DUF1768 family)